MTDFLRSEEKALELIEAYKNLPLLWDPNLKDYNNKEKRNAAYDYLAKMCGCNAYTVSQKIKNLRTYFIRETKKLNRNREKGKYVKGSKWFAYDYMTFLLDVKQGYEPYEDQDNYFEESFEQQMKMTFSDDETEDTKLEATPDSELVEPLTQIHIKTENLADNFQEDASEPFLELPPSSPILNPLPRPRRKRTHSTDEQEVQKKKKTESVTNMSSVNRCMERLLLKATNQDRFSLFGEYIAGKLRRLYNARGQALAENEIQNIVFKYEMQYLPENNVPTPNDT